MENCLLQVFRKRPKLYLQGREHIFVSRGIYRDPLRAFSTIFAYNIKNTRNKDSFDFPLRSFRVQFFAYVRMQGRKHHFVRILFKVIVSVCLSMSFINSLELMQLLPESCYCFYYNFVRVFLRCSH